ncbi:prepilin-type N-terminal cleavage/methylation domain-containing protein [Thermodesulfovibrio thiophilus]|uniref:prepilin-type N-terminal cleavage/methylation domain-containing protein n=1 Tax=Thermodesulfovibrio thiophilus TaxID=340095 RepID=UPI00184AE606|nr:prepilin-type N-terminal cleavage/methylation domain-containing protein [Thermodesulfovibrio thiophilus]HHW20916.1 prepilin-type N-terminal cleavage/methylation domain-containing protein [Thermodesulfovibrio thiophilus]
MIIRISSVKIFVKQKGYSIIEILIVIAIMGILAGGILSAYKFIARENATRHFVAKQEQDAAVFINQIVKDIEAAGFGIDNNNLTLTSITSNSLTGDTLTFPSVAARQEQWSGCWAALTNGSLTIKSKNFMGQDCQFTSAWYIVLDPVSKEIITQQDQCIDSLCSDLNGMTGLAFYATNDDRYNYPQAFMVSYYLTDNKLPKECAPANNKQKIYNLIKTLGTSGSNGYNAEPIVSCVLNFRIRAGMVQGGSIIYQDTFDSSDIELKKVKLLRLCMVLQIGVRQDSVTAPPNFSDNCAGGPAIDNSWWNDTGRWYRWKVIEQDIALRNYQ